MGTRYETRCPALLIHHWQRQHPKSLYSQAPANFSSLGWKQKTCLVAGGGKPRLVGRTSVKMPRPLDLNQLSMIIIDIHTLPHNKSRGHWGLMPHYSALRYNKLEVVGKSPLHEKGTWAMLLGGLCLWSILSARKPAWGWTAQKVTHRTIKHLCQVTSSVCSLPWHYPPLEPLTIVRLSLQRPPSNALMPAFDGPGEFGGRRAQLFLWVSLFKQQLIGKPLAGCSLPWGIARLDQRLGPVLGRSQAVSGMDLVSGTA